MVRVSSDDLLERELRDVSERYDDRRSVADPEEPAPELRDGNVETDCRLGGMSVPSSSLKTEDVDGAAVEGGRVVARGAEQELIADRDDGAAEAIVETPLGHAPIREAAFFD